MDGIHDLGGMQGFGPRAVVGGGAALPCALGGAGVRARIARPRGRCRQRRRLPARHRAARPGRRTSRRGYYGRWLAATELLMRETAGTTADAARHRLGRSAPSTTRRASPSAIASGRGRCIRRGTRACPRYARGLRGTVALVHPAFVFPDTHAHGRGEEPQHVYAVRFAARELWGDGRRARRPGPRRLLRALPRAGRAMSTHDHDHDDDDDAAFALRTEALEALMTERGLVPPGAIEAIVRHYEQDVGPLNGARVVARAWADAAYRAAAPRRRHGRDRRARLRGAAGRAHGRGRERAARAQRRRVHALLLLSVARPRAAAVLVQGSRLPLPHRPRAAPRARRDGARRSPPTSRSASGTRAPRSATSSSPSGRPAPRDGTRRGSRRS